jgi:hypothetical protein
MDDILNGYRSGEPQPKSVSPTKTRFREKWDLEPHKNDTQVQDESCLTKKFTSRKKTKSKVVDFDMSMDKRVASPPVYENSTEHENVVAEDKDTTIQEETTMGAAAEKIPSKLSTGKSVKILKRDSSFLNEENSNSFPKQLKILQNDTKVPEKLLKDLIHTLNNDKTSSNTARFLAKMLNNDENSRFSREQQNCGSLVSLQLGNTNEVNFLSNVKKRQRHEAQRLRIMRTIVLAYDSVWHERVKKISTAA